MDTGITWTSSNEEVATVSTTGLVTGLSVGTTTITATTENGKTATSEIEVQRTEEEIRPESITITATTDTLILDQTDFIQLTVTISPENANTDTLVTWTSSNEDVATVSTSGLVTAKSVGTTTIIATTENGKTSQYIINVEEQKDDDDNNNDNNDDNNNGENDDGNNVIGDNNSNNIGNDDENNDTIISGGTSNTNSSNKNNNTKVDTTTIEPQSVNKMEALSNLPYAGGNIKTILVFVVLIISGGFAFFKYRKYKKLKI